MRINCDNRQTFQGARLRYQSFENFQEYAIKNDLVNNFRKCINSDNYINEGFFNKVYSLPDNPVFLLRVKKAPVTNKEGRLIKLHDDYPDLNVGQEIARLSDDVTVIIAQNGKPCGIRNYEGKRLLPLKTEDVKQFAKYISDIAEFPVDAYENLIKEARLVGDKVNRVDIQNPQNVLYDCENLCFNIVDISDKGRIGQVLSPLALASQLCDYMNLFSVLKLADFEDKNIISDAARQIIKKIRAASENTGLKASIKPYLQKIYALFRGKPDEFMNFWKFRFFYTSNK